MASFSPAPEVLAALRHGVVIPAHPLALTAERTLDESGQRALTAYYAAAGAGGIAVGVHTTQFEIREPRHGLLRPVLELAREVASEHEERAEIRLVMVAGVCGETKQAVAEAELARDMGYDLGLVSLAALGNADEETCLRHCREIAASIPLFGFYLQPAVGGRVLSRAFWRSFAQIDGVFAIKVAPFDRYQTLDVLRAVAESGRAADIALYTGNDDHIVLDLLSEYAIPTASGEVRVRIVGGLLGHWAVWTRRAVKLLEEIRALRDARSPIPADLLTRAAQITEANAAIFDAANNYRGCIAGIHEVLRSQGLMKGIWCLDANQGLSPGQAEEIALACDRYPDLHDDAFVREHLGG